MLGIFLKSIGRRNFSNSALFKNIVPNSEKQPSKPVEGMDLSKGVPMDFIPTERDKVVLVLSGRYKSKSEIPQRVRYSTLDNAKSRLRIRLANILMVGIVICCCAVIWNVKQRVKRGENMTTARQEEDKRILEKVKKY